ISAEILARTSEITQLVGRVESLPSATPQPKLRRKNRIRTVQATLEIEGSTAGEPQVTAVLDGKRVLGDKTELREVQNAIAAYERVSALDPTKVSDLLAAHATLMDGLVSDAGAFRRGNVGVLQGSRVAHVAPPAARVRGLVEQLFDFLRKDREVHPILKAAIAHYEIEFIHPFSDGNGRMGRLWQHRLLTNVHPVFEHVPVESIVRERQKRYYAALGAADRAGDLAPFLSFALEATRDALSELVAELRPEPATAATRLERARGHFVTREFSRAEYLALFPTIATATASRDLRAGVDENMLERKGDKATTRYRFV
ncbi:MAG: Fic family protein, partial [Polyangiales bacterium]